MNKFDYLEFCALFKHFGKSAANISPFFFFFLPVSFVYTIVLQVFLFATHLINCLFGYIPNSNTEHIAIRITGMLLFSFILTCKFLILGALDLCIFVFGFFYDLTNAIMTLGKETRFFVNL